MSEATSGLLMSLTQPVAASACRMQIDNISFGVTLNRKIGYLTVIYGEK